MADDVDYANDLSEKEANAGVARIRANAGRRTLLPTGTCHYCDSLVNSNQLFCDKYCAEDYEKERAFKNARATDD